MKISLLTSFGLLAALATAPVVAQPQALIVADPQIPGYSAALAKNLDSTLRNAGYAVNTVSFSGLDAIGSGAAPCDLLAITDMRVLPRSTAPPIEEYLAHGGHAVFLDAPGWTDEAVKLKDGRWVTPAQLAAARSSIAADTVLFDFAGPGAASDWYPLFAPAKSPGEFGVEKADAGLPFGADMHVRETNFQNFSGYHPKSKFAVSPFGDDKALTVFWARGDARTTLLSIEWDERNGSRWVAIVPLTQSWRRYELGPEQFTSWQNQPAIEKQGFHPAAAAAFSFGLSKSHTNSADGSHEYWLAQIGVAPDVAASTGGVDMRAPLEAIWPPYKVFPIHGKVRLTAADHDAVGAELGAVGNGVVSSPQPRPSGLGILKARPWRWQSIVTASDASTGQYRGSPVTRMIHAPGAKEYPSAVYEAFTVSDPAFYTRPETLRLIGQFAARAADGRFLLEGGADAFTYFEGDPVTLGATVVNVSRPGGPGAPAVAGRAAATVEVSVTDPAGKIVFAKTWPADLGAGTQQTLSVPWQPAGWPEQGYTVSTRLIEAGRTVDKIEHKIYAWKPAARPDYVTIRPDGHFWLDGKPWRANGIYYAPSSSIGVEDWGFFEGWLKKSSYDPEIVHRDLSRIANLGFNAICVGMYVVEVPSRNLLDLLRQARSFGLHVNLALRPGMPSNFVAKDILKILSTYRLPENDTVFAYDIAWEPTFGDHDQRASMDPDWRAWVLHRYGSVAQAEAAWGSAGPRDANDELTNPSDKDMAAASGPGAPMIGDYRRFLDDWEQTAYSLPVAILHKADPHHAVSFRMADADCPIWYDYKLAYQFQGLARAVDFLSPEAYGVQTGSKGVRAGCFWLALGRSALPVKPILWAEGGKTVWGADSENKMIAQADYYRTMYSVCLKGGADGMFFWWYPGGYRMDEKSDCGVVGPDGFERPSAQVVRQESAAFLNAPLAPAPDVWLQYDPYAYRDGAPGIYRDLGDKFTALEAAGHRVGLKVIQAP